MAPRSAQERRPMVARTPRMPEPEARRPEVLCQSAAASIPADAAQEPNVLLAKIRAIMFFSWSFMLSLPLFVTMLAMAPFVQTLDKYK
ncbi:hypothetical protein TSOC_006083 [Tetrabaena socialis]|uniref:Uncharacterized protein n=1 Tax=Tetrabaena socialis TaxID=47790 RepID=A0A2J8A4L3_9CHLO|nr:hypothetical protein TSOC_006083 [Tetrabaena socialis]|eukprot:PNH07459.1 hypothetical protein TSOC_006083 [Tetrabaena socialis]